MVPGKNKPLAVVPRVPPPHCHGHKETLLALGLLHGNLRVLQTPQQTLQVVHKGQLPFSVAMVPGKNSQGHATVSVGVVPRPRVIVHWQVLSMVPPTVPAGVGILAPVDIPVTMVPGTG